MEEIIDNLMVFFADKIFNYPGAFVRWCFLNKKMKFKQILEDNSNYNLIIGIIVTVPIYILLFLYFGFIYF